MDKETAERYLLAVLHIQAVFDQATLALDQDLLNSALVIPRAQEWLNQERMAIAAFRKLRAPWFFSRYRKLMLRFMEKLLRAHELRISGSEDWLDSRNEARWAWAPVEAEIAFRFPMLEERWPDFFEGPAWESQQDQVYPGKA